MFGPNSMKYAMNMRECRNGNTRNIRLIQTFQVIFIKPFTYVNAYLHYLPKHFLWFYTILHVNCTFQHKRTIPAFP